MDTLDDFSTLKKDASLSDPLRRVAYEAGMMLGLEATRDEQAYHRRRLNRHQYWLQGYGTLAGMAVNMQLAKPSPEVPVPPINPFKTTVRLLVSPGIGIDGLGREVLIRENYCIDLREWLNAQTESLLREGYSDPNNQLWLKVCVRQKDCPVAKQPVLARKLNLGTDAVQPSRTAESVQLELIPELPPELLPQPNIGDDPYQPWASHDPLADEMPVLTDAENQLLQQLKTENPQAGAQLELHARLLHALDRNGVDSPQLNDELNKLENSARLLLARIRINNVTDINKLVLLPPLISINNLVRPFLVTASQLAWLARQP